MTGRLHLTRLARDTRGGALIEFAVLCPVIFAMMLGVLQVGVQMWNYNSMRAIAADTVRYTVVEYQKSNQITASQIQTKAIAIAVNSPYSFNTNDLTVTAANPTSDITGMTKYTVSLTYTPPNFLNMLGVTSPVLSFTRPIYVS
jgi:Flp pilus assembly protein TadG